MTILEYKEIELKLSKILVNGIKGFIKFSEMMRRPGIVFTEEQKRKIMGTGDTKYQQKEILLLLEDEEIGFSESIFTIGGDKPKEVNEERE